jgi:predicted acetyltransferase
VLEPLADLLTDARAVRERERADFLWVRLLDVTSALGARRYRGAGRIVLDVRDPFRPGGGAEGTFELEGGPDGAQCVPSAAPADMTLDVADLGASYLGGRPLWLAAAARRVVEHRAGAVAAFDHMFGTDVPPWCHTWF